MKHNTTRSADLVTCAHEALTSFLSYRYIPGPYGPQDHSLGLQPLLACIISQIESFYINIAKCLKVGTAVARGASSENVWTWLLKTKCRSCWPDTTVYHPLQRDIISPLIMSEQASRNCTRLQPDGGSAVSVHTTFTSKFTWYTSNIKGRQKAKQVFTSKLQAWHDNTS